MKTQMIYLLILTLLITSCAGYGGDGPVVPDSTGTTGLCEQSDSGDYVSWGTYDMVIARDGSEWEIVPRRSAEATWGYHLNAVKLLEVSPGQNCIRISKISVQSNGDLAVDIEIEHPYDNAAYTGFDVRGIIMFPSSQYIPDNDVRIEAGLGPLGQWSYRFASYRRGDAELMNADGYTTLWSPEKVSDQKFLYELEEGFPIFGYYEGTMASGDELGVLNGFKRYYTNETRHMFEAGKTQTRTFIIRPPEQGPIYASYAVYAHWAEPLVIPVTNPVTDFGPEANSAMPYEFYVEQIGPYDFDTPKKIRGNNVIWHIKTWEFPPLDWYFLTSDLMGGGTSYPFSVETADDVCPDCYRITTLTPEYGQLHEQFPGTFPVICRINYDHDNLQKTPNLGVDYYILWLDIEPLDDQW